MKTISSIILVLFLNAGTLSAQQIPVLKFAEFKKLTSKQNDTTYVINFWATWCKPCVAELPSFEKVNLMYADKKLKVILVSLDFKRELEKSVMPFIIDRKIKSQVVLLDELDYNSWIDKVSPLWGGSIPATLIINNSKKYRKFYEKEFTFEELQKAINEIK